MSVIVVEQLTKLYGRRIGVRDLNLRVPEGMVFGFLGPNGSGKTTTIRVLVGLLKPTDGSARVFGLDCRRDSHRIKAEVGYLPGDLRLYPWLTLGIALPIFGRIRRRDLVDEGLRLADEFELDPTVRVRSMSRGMRQKLGLILALAHQPRLLILDEPTSSLDPLMQEKLYRHLRTIASAGRSVFFSSHTLSEVEQLCDRVAILRNGKLVADESLDELRSRAKRAVTIRWRDDARLETLQVPKFLDVFDKQGKQWQASLTGSARDLVQWTAGQPIDDMTIEQPDLARVFHRYYE